VAARRRRLRVLGLVLVLGIIAGAYIAVENPFKEAVREITLPLRHEDIIRQQARDKDLDPALIAAVIYEESRFRDQTSPAGAKGLMQILPGTATFIARKTGGTRFELRDLATPQINIAYGSWYLQYLLQHYDGEEEPAIAAYNAGLSHVDGWVARAGDAGDFDPESDIRFPETRDYVRGVLEHRDEYAEHYERELGL
jgi:soluble lytic murein transglycosylase